MHICEQVIFGVCVCVRLLKLTYKTQVKGGDDAWKQTRGKQLTLKLHHEKLFIVSEL